MTWCLPGKERVADTAEGGSEGEDLVHVAVNKLEALGDEIGDLEKGGGDEDGDD